MPPDILKRFIIFLTLGLLMVSAFFIRLENFINTRPRSIDEIVYARLAFQVYDDINNYNTIEYGGELMAKGRELPDYFFRPLYKYPPLFTFLTVLSMRLFEDNMIFAYLVSLASGVALIPLVYFMGRYVYGRAVGFAAAVLMAIDPVTIITSQKLWIETTLALFMMCSLFLFLIAIKEGKHRYLLYSGLFCGFATNVKYTGILLLAVYGLYALLWDRQLWRNKFFIGCLLAPFVTLIPWLAWNLDVYGMGFMEDQIFTHSNPEHLKEILSKAALFAFVASGAYLLMRLRKIDIVQSARAFLDDGPRLLRFRRVLLAALCIVIIASIIKSVNPLYLPRHSWKFMSFYYEPPTFYLAQSVEFSLFYLFAFAGLLLPGAKNDRASTLIKITAFFLLAFYSLWGNYQSRYIQAVIPLLLILAASYIYYLIGVISAIDKPLRRYVLFSALLVALLAMMLKVNYINTTLSYTNNMCYY